MKTIMARKPHDSFSFSRRYFTWKKKPEDEDNDEEILTYCSSSQQYDQDVEELDVQMHHHSILQVKAPKKKLSIVAVSKLRSAFTFGKSRSHFSGLGTKVVGTLSGYRRGHVHFAFQEDPKLSPAFLVELATPTSVLVKESLNSKK